MKSVLSRRGLLAIGAFLPISTTIAQTASSSTKFTQAAFDAAQSSGKSILVEVSAPWCPTCKAQKPIISSLNAKSAYKTVTVLEVDFDSQKDVLRKLGVRQQSTLIAFKGKKETSRSVGETKPEAIEALMKSSI